MHTLAITHTRTAQRDHIDETTMGRSPCCCHDAGVKKGPWTEEEDRALVEHIQRHGGHVSSWRNLPKAAALNRCGKSCRLRWTNYLRPDIKRGNFTADEETLIIRLHAQLGNRWSTIATHLEGRTDNEIKNYWNTHIRKKLLRMGIDPVTHQRLPPDDIFLNSGAAAALAASPGAALLSAAASLGGLNTALMQVQALQLLLQAVNNGGGSSSPAAAGGGGLIIPNNNDLNAAAAAENAILNATTTSRGMVVPSFFEEQTNLLAHHANYASAEHLSSIASFAEQHDVGHVAVLQRLNASSAPGPVVGGVYAEADPPLADALVPSSSAAYRPQEVVSAAAADDRPVQGFAELLSEPIEMMPSMCSLEDGDSFWKGLLLESSSSLRFL